MSYNLNKRRHIRRKIDEWLASHFEALKQSAGPTDLLLQKFAKNYGEEARELLLWCDSGAPNAEAST